MSVWRWPSARWGVTAHQGERGDRATAADTVIDRAPFLVARCPSLKHIGVVGIYVNILIFPTRCFDRLITIEKHWSSTRWPFPK